MPLPKIDWSSVWTSIKDNKKVILIAALVLGLVLLFFFLSDRVGDAWFGRSVDKQKAAIANKIDRKVEVQKEIEALQSEKDQLSGEIKADTEQLVEDLQVREDLKKETNQALANLDKVAHSNTDIDRSAQEVKDLLDKLEANP
jgi:hypothetical protein